VSAGGSNSCSQRDGVATISFDTAFVAGFIMPLRRDIAFQGKNSPKCARPRLIEG